ncbi:uncharacterized protein LOC128211607 [Mya arenaria]|uniref:uncharacterized protein LOC128211607 n=1 Tax=Mya arenaria TaxID=6604 RepID=UPI0022E1D3CA|nr:uncharacterized protein LOC128211607 [Mya arenaria]XP_052772553.1 uncharacterized protein LOC128211607 [Mya arenaria]
MSATEDSSHDESISSLKHEEENDGADAFLAGKRPKRARQKSQKISQEEESISELSEDDKIMSDIVDDDDSIKDGDYTPDHSSDSSDDEFSYYDEYIREKTTNRKKIEVVMDMSDLIVEHPEPKIHIVPSSNPSQLVHDGVFRIPSPLDKRNKHRRAKILDAASPICVKKHSIMRYRRPPEKFLKALPEHRRWRAKSEKSFLRFTKQGKCLQKRRGRPSKYENPLQSSSPVFSSEEAECLKACQDILDTDTVLEMDPSTGQLINVPLTPSDNEIVISIADGDNGNSAISDELASVLNFFDSSEIGSNTPVLNDQNSAITYIVSTEDCPTVSSDENMLSLSTSSLGDLIKQDVNMNSAVFEKSNNTENLSSSLDGHDSLIIDTRVSMDSNKRFILKGLNNGSVLEVQGSSQAFSQPTSFMSEQPLASVTHKMSDSVADSQNGGFSVTAFTQGLNNAHILTAPHTESLFIPGLLSNGGTTLKGPQRLTKTETEDPEQIQIVQANVPLGTCSVLGASEGRAPEITPSASSPTHGRPLSPSKVLAALESGQITVEDIGPHLPQLLGMSAQQLAALLSGNLNLQDCQAGSQIPQTSFPEEQANQTSLERQFLQFQTNHQTVSQSSVSQFPSQEVRQGLSEKDMVKKAILDRLKVMQTHTISGIEHVTDEDKSNGTGANIKYMGGALQIKSDDKYLGSPIQMTARNIDETGSGNTNREYAAASYDIKFDKIKQAIMEKSRGNALSDAHTEKINKEPSCGGSSVESNIPVAVINPTKNMISVYSQVNRNQAGVLGGQRLRGIISVNESDLAVTYCKCEPGQREEVPVEQVFNVDGQLFKLSSANVMKIGSFQFYSFKKRSGWYLPVALLHKILGPEMQELFDEIAMEGCYNLTIISMGRNEIELLKQKCAFNEAFESTDLIGLNDVRGICRAIANVLDNRVVKMIATNPVSRKDLGGHCQCANCGLSTRRVGRVIDTFKEIDLNQRNTADTGAVSDLSVGSLKIGDLDIPAYESEHKHYINIGELVTAKIVDSKQTKHNLGTIGAAFVKAPEEIMKHYSCKTKERIERLENEWIFVDNLRFVVCMSLNKTGKKKCTLDKKSREMIARGEYTFHKLVSVLREDEIKVESEELPVNPENDVQNRQRPGGNGQENGQKDSKEVSMNKKPSTATIKKTGDARTKNTGKTTDETKGSENTGRDNKKCEENENESMLSDIDESEIDSFSDIESCPSETKKGSSTSKRRKALRVKITSPKRKAKTENEGKDCGGIPQCTSSEKRQACEKKDAKIVLQNCDFIVKDMKTLKRRLSAGKVFLPDGTVCRMAETKQNVSLTKKHDDNRAENLNTNKCSVDVQLETDMAAQELEIITRQELDQRTEVINDSDIKSVDDTQQLHQYNIEKNTNTAGQNSNDLKCNSETEITIESTADNIEHVENITGDSLEDTEIHPLNILVSKELETVGNENRNKDIENAVEMVEMDSSIQSDRKEQDNDTIIKRPVPRKKIVEGKPQQDIVFTTPERRTRTRQQSMKDALNISTKSLTQNASQRLSDTGLGKIMESTNEAPRKGAKVCKIETASKDPVLSNSNERSEDISLETLQQQESVAYEKEEQKIVPSIGKPNNKTKLNSKSTDMQGHTDGELPVTNIEWDMEETVNYSSLAKAGETGFAVDLNQVSKVGNHEIDEFSEQSIAKDIRGELRSPMSDIANLDSISNDGERRYVNDKDCENALTDVNKKFEHASKNHDGSVEKPRVTTSTPIPPFAQTKTSTSDFIGGLSPVQNLPTVSESDRQKLEMERKIKNYVRFTCYRDEKDCIRFKVAGFLAGAEKVFPSLFLPHPSDPRARFLRKKFCHSAAEFVGNSFKKKKRHLGKERLSKHTEVVYTSREHTYRPSGLNTRSVRIPQAVGKFEPSPEHFARLIPGILDGCMETQNDDMKFEAASEISDVSVSVSDSCSNIDENVTSVKQRSGMIAKKDGAMDMAGVENLRTVPEDQLELTDAYDARPGIKYAESSEEIASTETHSKTVYSNPFTSTFSNEDLKSNLGRLVRQVREMKCERGLTSSSEEGLLLKRSISDDSTFSKEKHGHIKITLKRTHREVLEDIIKESDEFVKERKRHKSEPPVRQKDKQGKTKVRNKSVSIDRMKRADIKISDERPDIVLVLKKKTESKAESNDTNADKSAKKKAKLQSKSGGVVKQPKGLNKTVQSVGKLDLITKKKRKLETRKEISIEDMTSCWVVLKKLKLEDYGIKES